MSLKPNVPITRRRVPLFQPDQRFASGHSRGRPRRRPAVLTRGAAIRYCRYAFIPAPPSGDRSSRVMPQVPRQPAGDPHAVVRESLLRNYLTDAAYLASAIGQKDLAAHLDGRARHNRELVVPWMESFRPLAGARVLEIGC